MSLRSNSQLSSPNNKEAGLPARTFFRGNGSPLKRTKRSNSGSLGLKKIIFAASLAIASVYLLATIMTLSQSNDPQSQKMTPIAKAVQNTPIGSLGPSGTKRKTYRYYDSLFYTALQYGAEATSSIEVGCASDPFLKYLDWIDRRTCVAPYFVEYGKYSKKNDTKIERVTADFMKYELPNGKKYDLLLCSQVLEHVPDPAAFMKKLISTATTSIISVPLEWAPCGKMCNHVTDHISYAMLLKWSSPHVPIYSGIVTERHDEEKTVHGKQRIILVYKME